jgi:heat shock protein HslJ
MMFFRHVAVVVFTSILAALGGASWAQDDPCVDPSGVLGESAFVVVTAPVAGAEVESGFAVSGCSRTFESTVNWRLLAGHGNEVTSGFVTGGGADGPASFSFTVDFEVSRSQLGHLEVFEVDASEGEGFPPGRTVLPIVLITESPATSDEPPATPESILESAMAKVAQAEQRLAGLDSREETLEPERAGWKPRTLRIWSDGEIPLKLSVNEPNAAGRITGETIYYYDEGSLFYVRRPQAQAVFSEGGLEGWYDEIGRPVPMGAATAGEREGQLAESSRRWLAVFAGTPSAPTWDHLGNASYDGIYEAAVQLAEGRFEGEPYASGGASRPTVTLVRDLRLVADLSDEAGQEAVVLLSETSGGSGSRLYVAVVGLRDGEPVNLGTAPVGDRPQIRGLDVRDRMVQATLVEHGPADAACCPGQLATRYWMLQGNELAEVASQATGRLSVSILEGSEWTLAALDRGRPASGPARITLTYEDGRITGSAGCNGYFAEVDEPSPGRVRFGPVGSTRRACSRELMEAEQLFLDRLGKTGSYGFHMGKLVLAWSADGESGSMIFER